MPSICLSMGLFVMDLNWSSSRWKLQGDLKIRE